MTIFFVHALIDMRTPKERVKDILKDIKEPPFSAISSPFQEQSIDEITLLL